MSFGELVQNIITIAGGGTLNEIKKHPKIPQGIAYLNSYNKNMPVVPGSENKKWKPRSTLIEGFDGLIGPTDANLKNKRESDNLSKIEDDVNRNISTYATSYKSLMEKAHEFLTGNRTYGKSIYAAQAENSDVIKPNWVGCYAKGTGDGLINQEDMVDVADMNNCKTRASDLGYPAFTLYNDAGKVKCAVGQDVDRAQSLGLATKKVTSYSFSKSSGANMGGLMMNGQVGTYQDDISNNLKTDLTAMPNCDMILGGRVNPNNLTATYGYNCNGTAKSAFTAPNTSPIQAKTCAQYNDSDYNLPSECIKEMWSDAGCNKNLNDASITAFKNLSKEQVRNGINLFTKNTFFNRYGNVCYEEKPAAREPDPVPGAPAPIIQSGSKINTATGWASRWMPINDGTYANSLSILNDGTIICTNANGGIYTRPNLQMGWTQSSSGGGNTISSAWDGGYPLPPEVAPYTRTKCLDQDGGNKSSSLQMQVMDCQPGNPNQVMTYNSDLTVTIPGNLCLDVNGAQTWNGTKAIQYQCHGGSNQKWIYGADKTLRPQFAPNKCLDSLAYSSDYSRQGPKIGIWDCNGYPNQTWNINKGLNIRGIIQINDGTYLGIGFDNLLYSKSSLNATWNGPLANSTGLLSIIQLNDGTFVCVGTENSLWKKSTLTGSWRKITCPNSCCVTFITKMLDGTIAAVGTNGLIYTRTSLDSPWVLVDGSMTMSSVAQMKDGTIIGTSTDGAFYRK